MLYKLSLCLQDPITSRYGRLNKQGCISNSPCTAIRWVPASTTLFLVSHADGTIVVYDKEREDGAFSPQEPTSGYSGGDASGAAISEEAVVQPHRDWDPTDNIFVTMPPWHPVTTGGGGLNVAGKSDKDSKVVKNPVSHWRISRKGVVGGHPFACYDLTGLLSCESRFRLFSRCKVCRGNLGRRLSTSHRRTGRRVREIDASSPRLS